MLAPLLSFLFILVTLIQWKTCVDFNYFRFGRIFGVPPTSIILCFEKNLENATEVLNPAKFMDVLSFAEAYNPLEETTCVYYVLSLWDLGISGNIRQAAHFKGIQTADLTPHGSRKHHAAQLQQSLCPDGGKGKFSL